MAANKFSKSEKKIMLRLAGDTFQLNSELPNPMALPKEINHVKKMEQKLSELQRYVSFNPSLYDYIQETVNVFEKFRLKTLEELREVKTLSPSQREHLDNERRQIILIGFARITEIKNRL